MKKRLIIAGFVLFVGAIAALFVRFGSTRDQGALVLSGNIEATEVRMGFKVPGRVLRLYADEGGKTLKGEKLASLDSAEFESLVNQSRASVTNATAQRDKALKDRERCAALFREGAIASQQMDAARTAYDVAESQLSLARAALWTAEVRLRDSVILAPIDGVVLKKNSEEGETIGAGTPIYIIGVLERPWVKVYVKEDTFGMVKLGQKAEIAVDSFPGKRYEGVVTYISSEAEFTPKNVQTQEDRVKLVFGVKVSVQNQNDELKPGMPADVRFMIQ